MRFHKVHGKNIRLDQNDTIAYRMESFSHALVFSERPLFPGELFMVEIEETTSDWTGAIKIGLSIVPPETIIQQCNKDVIYENIYHTTVPSRPVGHMRCTCGLYKPVFGIGNYDWIITPFGKTERKTILPVRQYDPKEDCPTDVGGRVGLIFAHKKKTIHVHSIMNGFDCGPFEILRFDNNTDDSDDSHASDQDNSHHRFTSSHKVNSDVKLWAVIDVYGGTKKIRIIQLYSGGK
ncbi:unnamed protein product [Didymodactylos carnosus]|uniref:NHR domain-containing protein n=1 Tax=Didymodactylos carnosus TaxID=1234261 RepID=A0A814ABV5_9BILA|nr:unnamed protein product [Didymodactylos carnosus]CAF0911378.1 unnamed protein product [Didymodactylos carnosus]CAF3610498.1 unnamed protein product [Didymodactylos carnosus]CAF3692496.1 unnamed protein product [Didymodactylos carnosus]